MTEKQLNELGFWADGNNRIYHNATEISFRVPSLRNLKKNELILHFYDEVHKDGAEYGKSLKASEIKLALNIN